MLKRITFAFLMLLALRTEQARCSIFGEENIALAKLVIGQLVELEKLAAALEVAKEQRELLTQVNEGINRVMLQIDAIDEILTRAQGLDPKNVRRISELSELILEVKDLRRRVEDVIALKLAIADQTIAQSALEVETTYTMGQEMIKQGSALAQESRTASPGRAAQITAAAGSAQMLSSGVTLQVLSHIAQIQAVSLDLQKTRMERELIDSQSQSSYFRTRLSTSGRQQWK